MAIWIELRCEDRSEPHAEGGYVNGTIERCWSWDNEGGGVLAADTVEDIAYAYRKLSNDAKKSGWKHLRNYGWICPHCVQYLKEQP